MEPYYQKGRLRLFSCEAVSKQTHNIRTNIEGGKNREENNYKMFI